MTIKELKKVIDKLPDDINVMVGSVDRGLKPKENRLYVIANTSIKVESSILIIDIFN